MNKKEFKLISKYKPSGDQPTAISRRRWNRVWFEFPSTSWCDWIRKTFTIANIVEKIQRPTIVLV